MSRFFASGDTDSDVSDVSGSESSSSEEEVRGRQQTAKFDFDSSSSEDEKRVVRTEKDKRFDAIKDTIKRIKNALKIKDWISVEKEFDALLKQFQKAKKLIKAEGYPKFYFSILLQIERERDELWSKRKSLNKLNAKALSSMKQVCTDVWRVCVKCGARRGGRGDSHVDAAVCAFFYCGRHLYFHSKRRFSLCVAAYTPRKLT